MTVREFVAKLLTLDQDARIIEQDFDRDGKCDGDHDPYYSTMRNGTICIGECYDPEPPDPNAPKPELSDIDKALIAAYDQVMRDILEQRTHMVFGDGTGTIATVEPRKDPQ